MCYQVFAEGHSRRRQYSDPMTFTLKEQRKWEELFFSSCCGAIAITIRTSS
jgi:hypothetical protein